MTHELRYTRFPYQMLAYDAGFRDGYLGKGLDEENKFRRVDEQRIAYAQGHREGELKRMKNGLDKSGAD